MQERLGQELGKTLSEEDAVSLARALALVDTMPEFSSGSVAPVVWIMKVLMGRLDDEKRRELQDWVVKHDPHNHYLPYG